MYRFVAVAGLLLFSGLGQAQDRKPLRDLPGEKKSEVFEEQEWYLSEAIPPVYGDNVQLYFGPSKEKADEAVEKWDRANKDNPAKKNWIARRKDDPIKVKVPVIRPAAPRDRPKIKFQDPKFVDPGAAKAAAKKAPELKGRKAVGEIGDLKVTFEFVDKDKVTITADGGAVSGDFQAASSQASSTHSRTLPAMSSAP